MLEYIICAIAITAITGYIAVNGNEYRFFSGFFCPVLCAFGIVMLFALGFFAFRYKAAEYKSNLINREYGTDYSTAEVFYASSVIDTIRELDRKRIELNVDLIQGGDNE